MKVLIIDDNAIVVEGCRRILKAENIETDSSSSATEALRILQDQEFDLLLMDIVMPEKDGFYMMDEVQKQWPCAPLRWRRPGPANRPLAVPALRDGPGSPLWHVRRW